MFQRNKGFTLLEVVIVIAIIGIIAFLVLAGFREGQKNYALAQASQQLVADFRQVQGMAIAGAETEGYSNIGGYGIRIQSASSYIIFLNDSSSAETGCSTGTEYSLKTVNLPSGVTINQISSNVFFAPPNPKSCINGDSETEEIELVLSRDSSTQRVTVTRYGMIEIE